MQTPLQCANSTALLTLIEITLTTFIRIFGDVLFSIRLNPISALLRAFFRCLLLS